MKILIRITLISAVFMLARSIGFAQPGISVQPADQIVNLSFKAAFRTTGSGAQPLSYQWFFASNAIAGAVTNVLTVTNAQSANAGGYFVVVTNPSGSVTSRVAKLTVNLPVALDPKVGRNIRLGEDSPLLPGLNQGEVHLARSYTDPNLILASFQDGIEAIHFAVPACTYSLSHDGGESWGQDFIPGLTKATGGTDDFGANCVAAVDAQGELYVASLSGPVAPVPYVRQVVINKSTHGGQSLGAPLVAVRGTPSDIPDKEWIAINTFPGAPYANRIALAYERGYFSMDGYSIYSDDGGTTWSGPHSLGPLTVGMQNLFLPDGSLAVLFWKFLTEPYGDGLQRMEMVLSKDGGATFKPATVVMDANYFLNPDSNTFASRFFPSACTDRQAGVIYVAVGAQTGATTNRASRILFTKSIDQGKTWSAPLQVNDTPSGKTVGIPAIAASPDGQHVTIEFYDKRNDPGENFFVDLYLAESFDGGETWEPNIRLSEFSSDIRKASQPDGFDQYFLGDYQGIVPSLNFETPAVAAWIDMRAGNADPYVVRIRRTKGTTFDAWRKLRFSTTDLANAAVSSASADPDGDGIPNLAEYTLGLEPNKADSSPVQITRSGPIGAETITVSYEKLAVLGDIRCSWQSSTNFVNWADVSPERETISAGRDPSLQRVASTLLSGEQMRFFRLSITRTGP